MSFVRTPLSTRLLHCWLLAALAVAALAAMAGPANAQPGVLMGAEQKANWANNSAPCPKSQNKECADEISQAQFVGWPFIAEHTGTVEAIFAALATGEATGAEVGIFANRKYHYVEIEYRGEEENGAKETWTPAMFKKYEFEIPPEDPGALLGTSGKVPESKIVNNGWTEFKLQTPVKVVKGEKYWLTNTAFQKAYSNGSAEFHKYQIYYHERVSNTEAQPWGNYTNEPHNWEQTPRTLKELPSPEQTKINCEKCNNEGWLQEEPKGFELLNTNRGAQEEGGQTYSYASGTIEEGAGEEAPATLTGAATTITHTSATLNGSVDPNGSEVTECVFEYGTGTGYGTSVPCSPSPGSGNTAVAVSAAVSGLEPGITYHYRVRAKNAHGVAAGNDAVFATESAPAVARLSARKGPAAGGTTVQITGTGLAGVTGVKFGAVAAAFEVHSSTSITATSPPESTGAVEVILYTPDGQSGASRKARFTYERPTIVSLAPASGPTTGGTEVIVRGSGFVPGTSGTTFRFGKGTAAMVDCASTSECEVTAPAASKATKAVVSAISAGKKSKRAAGSEFTYESSGAVARHHRIRRARADMLGMPLAAWSQDPFGA